MVRRLGVVLAVMLALAPPAGAGVLSPDGFTTAPHADPETFYLGIHPWGYDPGFPIASAFQSSGADVHFAGYAAAPDYDALAPGSCYSWPDARNKVECGLAPAGGEPFFVVGTDQEDFFREIGCHTGTEGVPCPRVFKIDLKGGDDVLSMWNFTDTLADERDPQTGQRPFVAASRSPMHGVEIDMGPGDDVVQLVGGPSTGHIEAGAGNDVIDTRGGHSASNEPVTGAWSIACGPGFDTVALKPDDTAASDCERVGTDTTPDDEDERTGPADVASTCGFARFDFYKVTHERSVVRKNRRGCVYLVSNRFARDLLTMAYNSDRNISQAFVDVLDIARRASEANGSAPSAEALEAYVRDVLPIPDGNDIIHRALPGWIQEGMDAAGRANPLIQIGQAAGSLAIPLRTLHRIHQIETKGACLQFVVGIKRGKPRVDSRVVYNPAHFEDSSGAIARVYQRKDGDFRRRDLNLACGADGRVHTGERRHKKKTFRFVATQTGTAG